MNDTEKSRCEEFARVLFGSAVKTADMESALGMSGSYEEFRIQVIANLATKHEMAKDIYDIWREAVERRDDSPDGNRLLHTLESISVNIASVETQMRAASVDLLEKLKTIDVGVSALASLQASVDGAREALASIRSELEMLEEAPTPPAESGK